MKKRSLNKFLGRKAANSSLFSPQSSSGTGGLTSTSTPIQLTDWENMNAVVSSASFPDSGTASVRARPKVNLFPRFTGAPEIQGFAVPTPTVPASHKGPASPAPENDVRLNGNSEWNPLLHSLVPDYMQEENIYIPPPPAMAPPPPPQFAPPPPPFQAPAVAPPNPPKTAPPTTPSPMPPSFPPAPPPVQSSYSDTGKSSDNNLPDLPDLPRPKFAPPPPPSQKEPLQQLVTPLPPPTAKALKVPPPKPVRYSSMQHLDIVSQQSGPVEIQRNPQNKARFSSFLPSSTVDSKADREQKAKSMVILQDSATEDLPAPANGKYPARVPASMPASDPKMNYGVPVKPARKNSSGIQLAQEVESLQDNVPHSYPSSVNKPNPALPAPVLADYSKPSNYSPSDSLSRDVSPPAEKGEVDSKPVCKVDSESRSWHGSSVLISSPNQQLPPAPNILQTKVLPSHSKEELSPPAPEKKDGPKSPMDLLLAAKRRAEKGRSLPRQSSQSSINCFPDSSTREMTSVQIHQSPSNPNSFIITPRADVDEREPRIPGSGASPPTRSRWQDQTAAEGCPSNPHVPAVVSLKHQKGVESSEFLQGEQLSSTPLVQNLLQSQRTDTRNNLSASELVRKPEPTSNSNLKPIFRKEESEEDFGFIPPPPEFANTDEEEEEEPSPNSPYNKPIYQRTVNPPPSPQTNWRTASNGTDRVPGPPVPKTKPQMIPAAPRLPTSPADLKLTERTKPSFTMHPSSSPKPAPTLASVTLQSILQKKMLEMDLKQKFTPAERDNNTWSTDQPAEPRISTVKPGFQPARSNTGGSNLQPDEVKKNMMNELKTQVKKKSPEAPALASKVVKSSPQNSSKQSHGMTFTVRPGTKQPITLLRQGQPC
ncbi:uncharacterized protein C6orf132 homolog isoform X2 [Polyodon spathula]|uniref:uncharacterized protein C6orf132 homolog isoform X2 n=1 Tax=Polyodon spathula TaxID=7913 RepID=UPI001B7F3BAF|nr:uncharacterized protein C6orf132 homolog isoform X2 [Polyodon spathula]